MFGSPMDASDFGTLAGYFADRPVVTYDPRGTARNPPAPTTSRPSSTRGPAPGDRGTRRRSGRLHGHERGRGEPARAGHGAPRGHQTAVAHEPPDLRRAARRRQVAGGDPRHEGDLPDAGNGPAMAKFIALVMSDGELPADYLDQPAPDPAKFGHVERGRRRPDNPLMRNMPSCNEFEVDVDALEGTATGWCTRTAPSRASSPAARGGRAVAAPLGRRVVELPATTAASSTATTASRPGPKPSRPGCARSSTPDRRQTDADRSPVGRPSVARGG